MEADRKRKDPTVNQTMLEERRRLVHHLPSSTHTLPAHSTNHFTLRGRSSAMRRATDTPLKAYAMYRAEYKVSAPCSVPSPSELPQLVQAKPGVIGGHFNSTSKTKCVPLPSIYDSNHVTRRGTRSITLHTERCTPSFHADNRKRTISDSLLDLTQNPHKGRQKEHMMEREMSILRSRLLRKEHQVKLHRQRRTFYMIGHHAKLFNKLDITPDELQELESKSFTQNKELYYGKFNGKKLVPTQLRTGPSKAVQKFENQLKEAREESRREFGELHFYSDGRISGDTSTPLLVEETEGFGAKLNQEGEQRRSAEIFMTQSKITSRNDDSAERTDF